MPGENVKNGSPSPEQKTANPNTAQEMGKATIDAVLSNMGDIVIVDTSAQKEAMINRATNEKFKEAEAAQNKNKGVARILEQGGKAILTAGIGIAAGALAGPVAGAVVGVAVLAARGAAKGAKEAANYYKIRKEISDQVDETHDVYAGATDLKGDSVSKNSEAILERFEEQNRMRKADGEDDSTALLNNNESLKDAERENNDSAAQQIHDRVKNLAIEMSKLNSSENKAELQKKLIEEYNKDIKEFRDSGLLSSAANKKDTWVGVDNLMQIGEQIKQLSEHEISIEEVSKYFDDKVSVKIGEARAGLKVAEEKASSPVFAVAAGSAAKGILIGAAAGVIASGGRSALARIVPGGALIAAAIAGGVKGASKFDADLARERDRRALSNSESEEGEKNSEFDKFIVDKKSAEDATKELAEWKEKLSDESLTQEDREKFVKLYGEIYARNNFSQADLISFDGLENVEKSRLELMKSLNDARNEYLSHNENGDEVLDGAIAEANNELTKQFNSVQRAIRSERIARKSKGALVGVAKAGVMMVGMGIASNIGSSIREDMQNGTFGWNSVQKGVGNYFQKANEYVNSVRESAKDLGEKIGLSTTAEAAESVSTETVEVPMEEYATHGETSEVYKLEDLRGGVEIKDIDADGTFELVDPDGKLLVGDINLDENGFPTDDSIEKIQNVFPGFEFREGTSGSVTLDTVDAADYFNNNENGDVITAVRAYEQNDSVVFHKPEIVDDDTIRIAVSNAPEGTQLAMDLGVGNGNQMLVADVDANGYVTLERGSAMFDAIQGGEFTGKWVGVGQLNGDTFTSYQSLSIKDNPFDGTFILGSEVVPATGPAFYLGDEKIADFNTPESFFSQHNVTVDFENGSSVELEYINDKYNYDTDPFHSELKSGALAFGERLKGDTAEEVFVSWINNLQRSPDQLVWNSMSLSGFQQSPEMQAFLTKCLGEGWANEYGLIDTEEEVNKIADMLAENPSLLREYRQLFLKSLEAKLDGGSISLQSIAEGGRYTTHHQANQFSNINDATKSIIRASMSKSGGTGLQLVDKDGNNVFDDEITRKLLNIPEDQPVDDTLIRINCGGQPTRVPASETPTNPPVTNTKAVATTKENTTTKENITTKENVTTKENTTAKENTTTKENITTKENTTTKENITTKENVTTKENTTVKENTTTKENTTAKENTTTKENVSNKEGIVTNEDTISGKTDDIERGGGGMPNETEYRPGTEYVDSSTENNMNPVEDGTPGGNLTGEANINVITDESGNPLTDNNGNVYITSDESDMTNDQSSVSNNTQTTYTENNTFQDVGGTSDVPVTDGGQVVQDVKEELNVNSGSASADTEQSNATISDEIFK